MTPEQWLAANTFYCAELAAHISPGACASYRQGTRMLNCNHMMINAHCRLCDDPAKAQPLPPIKRRFKPKFSRDRMRPAFMEQTRRGAR